MKRKSLVESPCAVARTLDTIGDWWSLLIVRDALEGRRRFTEFQKSLGIPKNVLSARLRSLVAAGIFSLGPASDGSAYQEYTLTEKGKGLFLVIAALREWGEDNLFELGAPPPAKLVDAASKKPVQRLQLRSHDDRLLSVDDAMVIFGD